jgi:hypothetical protein
MADPRERYHDHTEMQRLNADGTEAGIQTALPGIIQSYNAAAQTVTVQVAIKANVTTTDGKTGAQPLSILTDVPVQFPAGGGHGMTFPISTGDECLLVFASRCIDAWWQQGGVQPQAEKRMHDLSDGFAILGFRSKPRALSNVSTTSTQIRSDDGQTYVDINGAAKSVTLHSVAASILIDGAAGTVGISAPNGLVVDAPTSAFTGGVTAGFGTGDAVTLQHHEHPTAAEGAPSPPTPGS